MSDQHARIDLELALDMYDRRALTAKGLVEIYFRRSIIPGTQFHKSNEEICELLRLPERTFYRAVSELRTEEVLFHRTTGKTVYALEPETLYDQQKKGKRRSTNTVKRIPDKLGSQPAKLGSETVIVGSIPDELGSIPDELGSESAIVGSKTPPKPAHSNGSAPSSSLLQLSNNSSSSINQGESAKNANPDDEEEDVSFSFSTKKPVKASKHKLAIKALRSILEECSDDPEEWEQFFDWCDTELWDSFDEPVKNKIGWLKSTDPETELSRLEVNWINFISQPDENAPKTLSAPAAWQKVLGLSAKLEFGQRTNQLISPHDEPRLYQSVMTIGGLGKISAADPTYELPKLRASFIESYKNFSDN